MTPLQPGSPIIIGPQEGYAPQIVTLMSIIAWCQSAVELAVKGMDTAQLDFYSMKRPIRLARCFTTLPPPMRFIMNILKGLERRKFDDVVMKKFDIAMNLGEPSRKAIKETALIFI